MKNLFSACASLIERKPFKTLFLTLIMVAGMVAGATQLRLATGNDTLVQSDNSVYISNQNMEEDFGGDAILVLFEAENLDPLLNPLFLNDLYDVHTRIEAEEQVFSVLSLSSILHEMTQKQAEIIIDTVSDLSSGLNTMGLKMTDLGYELKNKDLKDPSEILESLSELEAISEKFSTLQSAQLGMKEGVAQLEQGLYQSSDGVASVATQLTALANLQAEPLKTQLATIATNLNTTSSGLRTMGVNTQNVQTGTQSSADALETLEENLSTKLETMKVDLSTAMSKADLLKMADGFEEMGEQLIIISDALNTFSIKSSMMEARLPTLASELDLLLYEDHELRSLFADLIVSDRQMMMIIKLDGNLSDHDKENVSNRITSHLNSLDLESVEMTISGKSILDSALKTEMKSSMMTMVALAIGLMFLILLLVFKVQWRLLSLVVIFVSVIATLGLMSWLKVPVTMVSMAVFPILIGLGIDYSIQFHNRFDESKDVIETVKNIGPAVAIAVIATMLGFISLFASPVPMIQDFGKMLTIGVVISFLGAMFILMPFLRAGQTNGSISILVKEDSTSVSTMERFFVFWTKWTLKLGILILISVFAIAAYGFSVDSKIAVETDIETFMPQNLAELEDIHAIRDVLSSTDQIAIYIEDDAILSSKNLHYFEDIEVYLESHYPDEIVDVQSIVSILNRMDSNVDLDSATIQEDILSLPENQRKLFVNEDNRGLILLNVKHLPVDEMDQLIQNVNRALSAAPFAYQITGKSVLDVEMVDGLTSGRITMTLYGLGLVFVALLLIYRNIFKALIPIIPVSLIIGISSLFMFHYNIAFTPITATLGALILGMGTEMTVMVMERYLEERNIGYERIEAMMIAMQKIGKAILASGLTTVGGFAVLLFSDFVILQDFGIMTVVNISLALLSTFLVLPPLIVMFDRFLVSKTVLKRKKV